MLKKQKFALLFSLLSVSISFITHAQEVTDTTLANAASSGEEWLTYGRDYYESRFSPLNQIDTSNVSQLGVAWTFDTDSVRGLEATPLIHDGILYATRPWSSVFAMDARTGAKLWDYDPQ